VSKQNFKGNLLNPLPVALVGANVDGKPNYMVIGYISPFDFGRHIFFSLYKERYTRKGIHENGTFSVNIPSEALIEETKICGSKSGRDLDKSTFFETFYGKLKTAPMIRESPINMECEVVEVFDYDPNEGIIGKVIRSYVDSECLVDGKIDIRRVRPFVWVTGADHTYYRLGDRIKKTHTRRRR
jgi:flavin reductase (DIM6/NTAB) family NADH-FMN oxidoreductase RutF